MDSIYLKEHVGDALSKGLSEIVQKQPVDPIEYLADWLRKYVKNQKEVVKEREDAVQLEKERRSAAEEERRREAMQEEERLIAEQEAAKKRVEETRRAQQAAAEAAEPTTTEHGLSSLPEEA